MLVPPNFSRRFSYCGLFVLTLGLGGLLPSPVRAQSPAASDSPQYTVQEGRDGVEIQLDGKPLTKYWYSYAAKPILWPLVGVGGGELTRGYPMRDATDGEKSDHIHHRSFWMTHGDVNGIDFWAEGDNCGKITPVGPPKVSGGKTATIDAKHEWKDASGKRILSDRWQLTFDGDGKSRWIDCVFSLIASDGDVVFGDTKEGSFGIRVAGTMKVDAGKGGELINAEGLKNKDAWGKASAWVDYHGPVDGKQEGIAVLNHPSSYGFPVRWHVRTYGLFAANPFGEHHFTGGQDTGGKTLPAGETWRLAFRVWIHDGEQSAEDVQKVWKQYSEQPLE